MTAREYLGQLASIDEQINQDLERLEEIKHAAQGCGAIDYSRDRVQTSVVGDKLCRDVSRYIDLDREINAEIDRFVDAKEQIIQEIRGLRDRNYIQVLYKVYVQYKTIRETAGEMRRSYAFVRRMHREALAAFDDMYDDLDYLC